MAIKAIPVVELKKNGDTYNLNSVSSFQSTSISFKLGEEFPEATPDGRLVKTRFTQYGDKLIQEQNGEKSTTIIREFTEDAMVATLKVNDVTCVRFFALET